MSPLDPARITRSVVENQDDGRLGADAPTALAPPSGVKPASGLEQSRSSTGAAGIDPTQADLGRGVVYRGNAGEIEQGYITSFNEHYVFVRYGLGCTSQATLRDQLEWVSA
jgi:hypothetical protein